MPDITNARQEFLNHVNCKGEVVCANLQREYRNGKFKKYILKPNFTPQEFKEFLDSIDFTYNAGYGVQELHGVILYANNTHSIRVEGDGGAEEWVYSKPPLVDEVLEYDPSKGW